MIQGMVGLPGEGKTYWMVKKGMEAADRGRQVFSVTPVNHPNIETVTYEECLDPYLPPGLILMDEVHLLLPSSGTARLKPEWYEKLSQTRKDGHDLIWTSQKETRVLRQLRDNSNFIWTTSAWLGSKDAPAFFHVKCWDPDRVRRGKPIESGWSKRTDRVSDAYGTHTAIKAQAAVREAAAR